jgi:hypothetical protein
MMRKISKIARITPFSRLKFFSPILLLFFGYFPRTFCPGEATSAPSLPPPGVSAALRDFPRKELLSIPEWQDNKVFQQNQQQNGKSSDTQTPGVTAARHKVNSFYVSLFRKASFLVSG